MEPSSIDLVKSLMEKEPSKRLTAGEALKHEWFQGPAGQTDMVKTRSRLKEFNAKENFKLGLLLISMSLKFKENLDNE